MPKEKPKSVWQLERERRQQVKDDAWRQARGEHLPAPARQVSPAERQLDASAKGWEGFTAGTAAAQGLTRGVDPHEVARRVKITKNAVGHAGVPLEVFAEAARVKSEIGARKPPEEAIAGAVGRFGTGKVAGALTGAAAGATYGFFGGPVGAAIAGAVGGAAGALGADVFQLDELGGRIAERGVRRFKSERSERERELRRAKRELYERLRYPPR